ncbi:DNA polymerase III subunit chi [Agrobacterium rhizogenes]|uniref:DNA polymerase III subunit chi n=1 Tax=Rhizobium rhizogenes TaxID=359 RepID=UPI00080FF70C|nr:DNA polymerase III subunit chi [Rhizobium rhizogenes]OCJ31687.1 DNA polymerase III subunit chi [Agrobacterium sp. B133/95]NTI48043.1 DNA polymerase III subunit chi [Rhizobium rhizogenes]NTI93416.1 DNA polymerase III subunit chi [Rhizobium rhizogenes]NTJ55883.1 DNA polymerase III subunit chi [Rhizobium rhizogenes]QRM37064.1 DNA polymerase III subunit chi [Rhizobium rhizogenes]
MTDVLFYHLTESKLEDALPPLIDKSVERGWQVAIQTREQARRDALDTHLWTYREDSFLPHGTDESEMADRQPVLLTVSADNLNNASVRFFIDGAEASDIDTYQRVVFIFDGYDQEQLEGARAQWKKLKGEGHNLTYWQQTQEGRWEKKA